MVMVDLPDGMGLFDLDPAEQVLPADGLEEGRVVGGHVLADDGDHLIVVLTSGDEPALASDQSGHREPPTDVVVRRYGEDVGVTLSVDLTMRIQICGPLVIERRGR